MPSQRHSPSHGPDNLRGGAWMLFSVVTASVMALAVREMSLGMDSRAVLLWRALATLAVLAPLAAVPAVRARLRFSRPWLHLARGGLIACSTQLGFYAIAHLPLATATVLSFTAPIFATILAAAAHGERVGPRRWSAVLAGFGGALAILRPGVEAVSPAMVAALLAAMFFSLALTMSRGVAEADGPLAAFASSVAVTAVVSVPVALPVFSVPASPVVWATLAVLVVSSAARSVGDIQAYRYGEAGAIGVLAYLRLVILGFAGWLIYSETIDAPTLFGGAVIVSATLYIARREARLKRRVAIEREAAAA